MDQINNQEKTNNETTNNETTNNETTNNETTNNETTNNETKKKSKALPIIIILVIVLLLAGGGGAAAYMLLLSPAAKSKEQVEVADGYLKDENYKKAISAYKEAISIDPKCVDAYLGLASVYEAQAEEAMDDEEYDDAIEYYESAIEALEKGIENVDDAKLTKALDDMESSLKSAKKEAKKAGNSDPDDPDDPDVPDDPEDPDDPVDPDDPDDPVEPDNPGEAKADFLEALADAEAGDIVTYGTYEQDGNKGNGAEEIEWYVLENKNGKVTLLSVYCLEGMAYHDYAEEVTWEDCTLREWLNYDFYFEAFSDDEQDAIVTVELRNEGHPFWDVDGGNVTSDKVYLLALEDFETYFDIPMTLRENPVMTGEFTDWVDYAQYCYDKFPGLAAEPTQAAIDNRIWYMTSSEGAGYPDYAIGKTDWWVRSPGYIDKTYASAIYCSADVGTANYDVTDDLVGVRPVITVEY